MLTISKPLSSGQAQSYHRKEFANAQANYYTEGSEVQGRWHGRPAERWGLKAEVSAEHFARLSEGQHPLTGEQLIRRRAAHEYVNQHGETIRAMEHRAGWDATFSAPKTVCLTALVGGDERVRAAHQEAVAVSLGGVGRFVPPRIARNPPPETPGNWI